MTELSLPTPEAETTNVDGRTVTLALSVSRTYDSALEILRAYKLTGNFHINLEIVLKDMDASDKVTFEVEPQRTYLADCRHVLFRPTENVRMGQFSEILSSIKSRIGFDATRTRWAGIS
jgi:hypothetical protein